MPLLPAPTESPTMTDRQLPPAPRRPKSQFMPLGLLACALVALAAASSPAQAQDHRGRPHGVGRAPQMQLDQRYHHDHYYPRQGYAMPVLPGGSLGSALAAATTSSTAGSGSGPLAGTSRW